mmetsp:Transcript_117538/g.226781  ORF Transcript_117538/g.226781 Transcript_117538/m.226781 type:complete len:297 (+) Transcript_117538:685-1575(+)
MRLHSSGGISSMNSPVLFRRSTTCIAQSWMACRLIGETPCSPSVVYNRPATCLTSLRRFGSNSLSFGKGAGSGSLRTGSWLSESSSPTGGIFEILTLWYSSTATCIRRSGSKLGLRLDPSGAQENLAIVWSTTLRILSRYSAMLALKVLRMIWRHCLGSKRSFWKICFLRLVFSSRAARALACFSLRAFSSSPPDSSAACPVDMDKHFSTAMRKDKKKSKSSESNVCSMKRPSVSIPICWPRRSSTLLTRPQQLLLTTCFKPYLCLQNSKTNSGKPCCSGMESPSLIRFVSEASFS